MNTITPIDKAGLQRMPDEELWNLHRACVEAISAMMHELEQRDTFPPRMREKAKAPQCHEPRRHRA